MVQKLTNCTENRACILKKWLRLSEMRSLFDYFLSRYFSFLIMSLFLQQSLSSEFGIEVSRCYNWSLVIKFRMNSIPHHIGGGLTSIAYGNDFISHKAICKSCFCKLAINAFCKCVLHECVPQCVQMSFTENYLQMELPSQRVMSSLNMLRRASSSSITSALCSNYIPCTRTQVTTILY